MDPLKAPSTPETKLHFLDYWRIIRIRKTVIIAVFLLVAITATFVTFFLPVSYSSKATIKIERDSTDVPSVNGQPPVSGIYDPYFIQTEFEVIRSQVILDKVIDKLNLNDAWHQKHNTPGLYKTFESRQILSGMIEQVNVLHYNSQKIDAEVQYVRELTVLNELKKLSQAELRQTLPTTSAGPDTILLQLLQDKIAAETTLVKLTNSLGEKSPDVIGTQKLITDLDDKITDRVRGIMQGLETKVASFKAVMDTSQKAVDDAKTNDITISAATRPYWLAKEALYRRKKFRDMLAVRTELEKVDKRMPTTTMVEIINKAEPGLRPWRPNKTL